MMTPRRFAATLALLAVAATAPAAAQRKAPARAAEPEFQGRSLTSWIADLDAAAPLTRTQAAYAVGSFGAQARRAVPALVKMLKDENPTVRYPAAFALGEIGPEAKEAVPALEEAVDDRSDDVGHAARKALKAIRGTPPE